MRKQWIAGLLLILSACTFASKSSSIIEGSSCSLPCWYGITPGITGRGQLMTIIPTLPNVDKNWILTQGTSTADPFYQETIRWGQKKSLLGQYSVEAEAYLMNQTIVELDLRGELGISLSQIIENYGEPEYVNTAVNNEGGTIEVTLFFPSKGIIINYGKQNNTSSITQEDEIWLLILVDPGSFKQFLLSRYSIAGKIDPNIFYPWRGYGVIKDKYWH